MYDKILIDTHCDTAYELERRNEGISDNTCDISLKKASIYKHYAQFFAIWSDKRKSDEEAYSSFFDIADHFKKEISANREHIAFATGYNDLKKAWNEGKTAAFLAVEDARILCNDIKRLDVLYDLGVRYLTLMWGGHTCIGASHDVSGGLTSFGKEVVRRCFELGIIPDVSHSNADTTSDIINIAYEYKKPVIASHSNCYSLYPHSRNLRDEHLKAIIDLGGIVGISLCPSHLTDNDCTVSDVADHIEKYIELGAKDILGLGCDLDGTSLPEGFHGLDSLPVIFDELSKRGFSDSDIEKIMYGNYYSFIERNLNT